VKASLELDARRAIKLLDSVAGRAIDSQPAAEAILADVRRMVSRQFSSAGAYRGPAWKPLKPATVAAKRRSVNARTRANANRPLLATEAMRRSLTDARRLAGASRATADVVVLESTLPRARAHHRGVPSRGIPARPLIRLTPTDTRRHGKIITRYLL
jgi:hypothetical protein